MTEVVKNLIRSDADYETYEVIIDGVPSGTDTVYMGPPRPPQPDRGNRVR